MTGTRPTRHKYYYDPKKVDLSVLRKEAVQQSKDSRMVTHPPVVVIHWHGSNDSCAGKEHETYEDGEQV